MHTCAHTHTHTHTYVHIHLSQHCSRWTAHCTESTYVRMYICACPYIRTYVHTYIGLVHVLCTHVLFTYYNLEDGWKSEFGNVIKCTQKHLAKRWVIWYSKWIILCATDSPHQSRGVWSVDHNSRSGRRLSKNERTLLLSAWHVPSQMVNLHKLSKPQPTYVRTYVHTYIRICPHLLNTNLQCE